MSLAYAQHIGATEEVLRWCRTTLAAHVRRHGADQTEAEHIIDWLASDAAPARLGRVSYAQAKQAADRWTVQQQRKGRDLIDGAADLEVVHDFLDGNRIVRLLTPAAYKREGYFMAHCVGGYNPSTTTIYSYRDAKNQPHATFEISRADGRVQQIKGKGNGPIHPRYIHPILTFLQLVGQPVRPSEMRNLGYVHCSTDTLALLQQFVEPDGSRPKVVPILGESYLFVGEV